MVLPMFNTMDIVMVVLFTTIRFRILYYFRDYDITPVKDQGTKEFSRVPLKKVCMEYYRTVYCYKSVMHENLMYMYVPSGAHEGKSIHLEFIDIMC